MPAAIYDIYAEQGASLRLHLYYTYNRGTPLDLTGINGEMQVRRSEMDRDVIFNLSLGGVTHGGITGEYNPLTETGVAGIGGISFNVGPGGETGVTGGILIKIDKNSMSYAPSGKHFYDLKLSTSQIDAVRLVEGTFLVSRQITK